MPDLDDLLTNLRAAVPSMTDEAFADGRARLLAATEPREAVVTRLVDVPPAEPDRRGRVFALAAGIVLVAVAATAVVFLRGGGTTHDVGAQPSVIRPEGGLPPLPSQPLNNAWELADKILDPTVPSGQYIYYLITTDLPDNRSSSPLGTVNEIWWPALDGQEYLSRTSGNGTTPTEIRQVRGAEIMEYTLAATPAAQYEAMRIRYGDAPDAQSTAANYLLQRLGSPLASAHERKLILETVSYLPDVEFHRLAHTTKQADATAISIVTKSGAVRSTYYFDPGTGRLVEVQYSTQDRATGTPIRSGAIWYAEPVIVRDLGVTP
ncbi:hypothetical protein [Alloactinosynnema sp. L-07]|uniref:hypothetical protein n=1 Tax=Alloactinosynnema sp. L-07 TaxID=1653480 RepID=UPI00065F0429|nr:hypothetical protein [Alloactinosynnema sp. L-07]CRK61180.1 hypothetical protein [Alloactinosynnema sp. L-07]